MIVERIYEWARLEPTKTALIHNDKFINYATFAGAIESSRTFLSGQNLSVGKVAVVLTKNLVDAWINVLALRALGLTTVHVPSLAQAKALAIRNLSCLVTTTTERLSNDIGRDPLAGAKIIVVPPPDPASTRLSELSAPLQSNCYGGHILCTSGTTGTYKKVLRSSEHEDQQNYVGAAFRSFGKNTIYHGLDFGLWTGAGFKSPQAIWHVGGCVVFDQRKDSFERFFAHGVTYALVAPWILKALLRVQSSAALPVNGFELAVAGGFLSLDLAERCVQKLTDKLTILYASTEISNPCLHSRFRTKDDLHWLMPVDQRSIDVVDESGRACPVYQEGKIRVLLSDGDSRHYLDDEEASAKIFRDGFFYPGDMAVRREDGRIRILGRAADVVNLKGIKWAVAPIEQAIQQFLQVDEVCLFSGVSEDGFEELIVAIQSGRELQRPKLQEVARDFVRFDRVRFSIRKEFPRTETGARKTKRALLKQLVFDEIKQQRPQWPSATAYTSRSRPIILFYNAFFGSAPNAELARLSPQDRAAFVWDRSLFADADAVVFHVPDLVFGSPNLRDVASLQRPSGQIWVAWSMESAGNYPVLNSPAFMRRFDLVMSYGRNADIWCPYYPARAMWLEALRQALPKKAEMAPVVMFQSAPFNNSHRIEYATELMKHVQVDSYGGVLKNRSLPEADRGRATKLATIARYKFCLSLENTLEIDYVTEKFFDPLLAGTVPVYRGAPNVDQFAPGKRSFIDASDFSGAAELAIYLKELARDDEAYQQYFAWREEPLLSSFEADLDALRVPVFEKLVDIVKRRRRLS